MEWSSKVYCLWGAVSHAINPSVPDERGQLWAIMSSQPFGDLDDEDLDDHVDRYYDGDDHNIYCEEVSIGLAQHSLEVVWTDQNEHAALAS